MRAMRHVLPLLVAGLLTGCAAERPAPPPRPMPTPSAPRPKPVAPRLDWQDLPLTPGGWSLSADGSGSRATFGSGAYSFVVQCDKSSRTVNLLRPGVASGNTMVVRTSYSQRALALSIARDGTATPYASLAASEPLLDMIALSRGRFTIEVPGLPMLVIPAWPEPARVIEDCRE